jgi:hypothetical protein
MALLFKRILREFSALNETLRMGLLRLQKQSEAITKEEEARDKQEQRNPIFVEVKIESVPTDQGKNDAREARNEHRDKIKVWIEGATLLAIIIYACLVYFQWQEMVITTGATQQAVTESRRNRIQADKSLNAAIQQFHLDQRAWLGLGDPEFTIDSTTFRVQYTAKNVGKTPAVNVKSNIAWASKPKVRQLQLSDIVFHNQDMQNGTVFPTQGFQVSNRLDPIPPNQSVFVSRFSAGDDIL